MGTKAVVLIVGIVVVVVSVVVVGEDIIVVVVEFSVVRIVDDVAPAFFDHEKPADVRHLAAAPTCFASPAG